ncbi:hypothetical protein ACFY2Q_21555 [Micromonospora sp. NPDC000316]|uniref:hypothetical protein n=1 Tax=Micromonospora sp. NPDC000316 TaxID=3364216 RepID=UPI00367CC707
MTPTALRVLAPVALLAGLTACSGAASPTAGASATPTTALPSAPGDASPTRSASPTPDATSSPPAAGTTICPVSAATLQRASGLSSATHRIDADQIKCAGQWATAGVIAVDPTQQGDGVLLFAYADGGWKKLGEGSALECSPFGIPPELGDRIGCRDH